ncbi:MAG: hypothetical protein PF447_07400, partial [Spirochaetaceae bacterium]|nr:hypothetical protein [Spirochaetaceae bacterium]
TQDFPLIRHGEVGMGLEDLEKFQKRQVNQCLLPLGLDANMLESDLLLPQLRSIVSSGELTTNDSPLNDLYSQFPLAIKDALLPFSEINTDESISIATPKFKLIPIELLAFIWLTIIVGLWQSKRSDGKIEPMVYRIIRRVKVA